jgi:hypothetical protein
MPQIQGEDTTKCGQLRSIYVRLLLVINVEWTSEIKEWLYCMDNIFP